jgi:hypothetical protein
VRFPFGNYKQLGWEQVARVGVEQFVSQPTC